MVRDIIKQCNQINHAHNNIIEYSERYSFLPLAYYLSNFNFLLELRKRFWGYICDV